MSDNCPTNNPFAPGANEAYKLPPSCGNTYYGPKAPLNRPVQPARIGEPWPVAEEKK
jgi:hypothetical protein